MQDGETDIDDIKENVRAVVNKKVKEMEAGKQRQRASCLWKRRVWLVLR